MSDNLATITEPAWFAELVEGYFRQLRRRSRRHRTLLTYSYQLRSFAEFLIRTDTLAHGLQAVGRTEIEAWQDELATHAAQRSQHVAAAALKGLLKWAAASEQPGASPTLWMHIILPTMPEFTPRPLARPDLKKLEEALRPLPQPLDLRTLRTRALFWVLYSSGSRIDPVLHLNRSSIRDGMADIIQKGGRRHTLVLSELATAAVQDYIRERTDSNELLFVGRAGGPLTRSGARKDLERLALEYGVPRFTPHQLRHSCGTELRRRGADIVLVAKHLGHRGLQNVQGYVGVELDERRAAVGAMARA
jgi:type 1 fimbriae regulatory protein FimE